MKKRVNRRKVSRYGKARMNERRYVYAEMGASSLPPDEEAELTEFCERNGIRRSKYGDSFYFTLQGKRYRISNHSTEISNSWSRNLNGKQIRRPYHSRRDNTVSIIAPRSRVKAIYEELSRTNKCSGTETD